LIERIPRCAPDLVFDYIEQVAFNNVVGDFVRGKWGSISVLELHPNLVGVLVYENHAAQIQVLTFLPAFRLKLVVLFSRLLAELPDDGDAPRSGMPSSC
jgi:hypothetical protein